MIEISYQNVMNGLNKGINMTGICPTQPEVDRLFRNAADLWYVKDLSKVVFETRQIVFPGSEQHMLRGCIIRFKSLDSVSKDPGGWKGFQGIFMIHPRIHMDDLSSRENATIAEMQAHNERFLDKWQA